jgi:site-specific recombinase XerD
MEKIKNTITSSLYLDCRKAKKNGKYPLKIRLFNSKTRKQKYFPTNYDFTSEEYSQIALKKTKVDKDWDLKLNALILKVNEAVTSTNPFSFEVFEKKLYDKYSKDDLVKLLFENKIKELLNGDKVGTADIYKNSLRSIELFLEHKKTNIDSLSISEVDYKWLLDYNNYMIKTRNNSTSTAGINMRNLRTIFNIAIENKTVDSSYYPFGKNNFTIKTQTKSKFILLKNDVTKLKNAVPNSNSQQIAKDFWLLSYYCCGINLKDLAYFKTENITPTAIKFFRKKTEDSKGSDKEITIELRSEITSILKKHINESNYYLFNIIDENDNAVRKKKKINLFNDFINKNIKKLCIGLFNEKITFYTARHSWATNMVIAGAPIIYIQQQLGHNDIKTTMNYIATLPVSFSKVYVDKFFEN